MEDMRNTQKMTWTIFFKKEEEKICFTLLGFKPNKQKPEKSEFRMFQYMIKINEHITLKIASLIALVQANMITNLKSKFQREIGTKHNERNHKYLLVCKALLGSNVLGSYRTNYGDIFDNDNQF